MTPSQTESMQQKLSLTIPDVDQLVLFGVNDQLLIDLERALDIKVRAKGNEITVTGGLQDVLQAEQVLIQAFTRARYGEHYRDIGVLVEPRTDTVDDIAIASKPDSPELQEETLTDQLFTAEIILNGRGKNVRPKTAGQRSYIDAIEHNTIVFGIGPAGTGKTYLAMAKAVQALLRKEVNKIILTRPAVEAGERLGFLPGTLSEKIDPYLRPLFDALSEMMEPETVHKLMELGTIEVAPLAYMRGRTLNDAFIILDEAQNTTIEQLKMFLTRLGFGSKMVVTGDITQIDLPTGNSGLKQAEKILGKVEDVHFTYLSSEDVVRHRLVADIVEAYNVFQVKHERSREQNGVNNHG